MKYNMASVPKRLERKAIPLPADPITVKALAVLARAVHHIGRNEILHLVIAAIVVVVAIVAIV
jgi:hypothetical protein